MTDEELLKQADAYLANAAQTPIPTEQPISDDELLKQADAYLAGNVVPSTTTPAMRPGSNYIGGVYLAVPGEAVDERNRWKMAASIEEEQKRRDAYLAENKPQESQGILGKAADFGIGLGKTIGKTFTSASTLPSKAIEEQSARGSKPGERTVDIEKTIGSTVNLVKSLAPGGKSPGEAIDEFSAFDEEGARNKLDRIYKTPIISDTGIINKESLDYSDLPRWQQNELSAAWAVQRTGVKNAPLWRSIIQYRGGVMADSSAAGAGVKRAGQIVDNVLFNIPSYATSKVAIGSNDDLFNRNTSPIATENLGGLGTAEVYNAGGAPQIKEINGKHYAQALNGDIVPLEGLDPKWPRWEQERFAKKAIFEDTKKQLEYQAMESWAQVTDPTILLGVGLGKKAAQTALGAVLKSGAKADRVMSFIPKGGALENVARVASGTNLPLHLPQVGKAMVNAAKADSNAGKAFRFVDKSLTNTAMLAGLAATGAPEGDKTNAAITAGLMSIGMTPLYAMQSKEPIKSTYQNINKNAIREILNTQDPKKLSSYTQKFVENDMKQKNLPTYAEYRGYLMSPTVVQDMAGAYAAILTETNTKPSMIMAAAKDLAKNPEFQKKWNEATVMIDNYGVSWFGRHVKAAYAKVLRESQEHNARIEASANAQQGGSASIAPQSVANKYTISAMKEALNELPYHAINDKETFTKYIDNEIAGGPPLPGMPPMKRLGRDVSLAIKAQVDALDPEMVYLPAAQIALVSNVAVQEATTGAKSMGMADMARGHISNMEAFSKMGTEEVRALFQALRHTESGMITEGPIHMISRRADKPEQWDLSPATASKALAEDFIEKSIERRKLSEQITELDALAKAETDVNKKLLFVMQSDKMKEQMEEIGTSTFLYQIHRFAVEKSQEAVGLGGKIRNAKLAELENKSRARWERKQESKPMRGAMRDQEHLIEQSRLESMHRIDLLDNHKLNLLDKKSIMMENLRVSHDAAIKELENYPKLKQNAAAIVDGKWRMPNGAKLSPESRKILNKARYHKSQIKDVDRSIKLTDENIRTFDQRIVDLERMFNKIDVEDIDPTYNWKEGVEWFDTQLALARTLGIEQSPYYQNVRRAVLDSIEHKIIDKNSGATTIKPIPVPIIAALRLLGSDEVLANINPKTLSKQKGSVKVFARAVNDLADTLALSSEKSRISLAVIAQIEEAMKDPAKTSIAQLLSQQKVLQDNLHVRELLADQKSGNGVFAKLEEMVNRKTNGFLTKADYRTLQVLVKDSPIGKGYRYASELEGIVEPWMITYKQDIARMMDSFISATDETVTKSLDATKKFLVESGQLVDPTDFDVKVAAALLTNIGDKYGAPNAAIFDLVNLANAWRDRVSTWLPNWNTAENQAVSVSRQLGLDAQNSLNIIFGAGNEAAYQKDRWARPLLKKLENVTSVSEKYVDHQRASNPKTGSNKSQVRRLLNLSMVGTTGRRYITTPFIDFVRKGYSKGLEERDMSAVKASIAPATATALDSRIALPDHLIVDGQSTMLGKAYEEWISSGLSEKEFAKEFVNKHIPERLQKLDRDAALSLKTFIADRLSFYGFMPAEQFSVFKKAVTIFQQHDREGLRIINALSTEQNIKDKTAYPPIEYNPWRLDTEVPTRQDTVTNDAGLFGSFADADRVMGKRYSTTPENQILKASTSRITEADLYLSPEEMYLNRYARLFNDTLSRKARASLATTAMFMENMGFKEQALALKNNIIEAGNLGHKEQPWYQKITQSLQESDNRGIMAAGIVSRQLFSPFIMLARASSTIVEQALQTATMQIGANPNLKGVYNAAMAAGSHMRTFAPQWGIGFLESFWKTSEKLNVENNGKNIKIDGSYAKALENIYDRHTKRVDPWVQARMNEMRRGGKGRLKDLSRSAATGFGIEATSNRMMWMLKERAENSSVRSILPQIGAIWQLGMGKYASGGKAELYRHLSNYMQGPLNNPALLSDVINMVENGQPVNALEAFGSFYMASSIGTWTHINIPKNIRTVAHIIPGADQFFTASSLGTYRLISAMANMGDLTTRQKAQVIASAVALAGISTGLGVVANETGFDWFQRISPLQWASASVMGPSQKSNQSTTLNMLKAIGSGPQMRSGVAQATAARAITLMGQLLDTYALTPETKEVDPDLKAKEESKYRRKIVQTLFDMTPVRVAVGITGMNVGDTYETVNSIAEGIGDITQLGLVSNQMSDYDLFVLKKSLEASASKADQIASKWEGYESAESGPIMPYPEQLALEVMGIFAKLSLDAQQAAWEKLAPPEVAAKMFPDDKRRILQRGARSADPASVAYIDAVEAAIARYESRIKNSEAKITGANQPEMDPSKIVESEATPIPTPIPANEEPIDVQR